MKLVDQAELHVVPEDDNSIENAISAYRLRDLIDGIESVFYALADAKRFDESDDRSAVRTPKEIREKYTIFFRTPEPGSFIQPIEVYDTRTNVNESLFDEDVIHFSDVRKAIEVTNAKDLNEFRQMCPSPVVAKKIIKGIQALAPKAGEVISLDTYQGDAQESLSILHSTLDDDIDWTKRNRSVEDAELIGRITRVDFDNYKLRVKIAGIGKAQEVQYEPDLEQSLLSDVREKRLKLFCSASYSPDGVLEKIEKIKGFEEVVLRRLKISSFECGDREIFFNRPLEVEEKIDPDTQQLFMAEIPILSILVFSEFQADILDCIKDELANKWEWIVEEDDEVLTPGAVQVKRTFLSLVKSEE